MYTLQRLLITLDGQKLSPGYLTPAGSGTALETVLDLKRQADTFVINASPWQSPAALLTRPAFIASLKAGQDVIYLNGVDGNLDLSQGGPAYRFTQPV
jgi:hypothetical protein